MTASRPREDWLRVLEDAGVPCGPILDYEEVFADPQVRERGIVQEMDHPTAGRIRVVGPAVKLSETPATLRRPSPRLGEHTGEVLREIGYDTEQIRVLSASGAVVLGPEESRGGNELLYEIDGPLAFVTFNRPQARNAMTWAMYDGLVAACERFDADPDLRVLVLRGAGGKAFVAGTDIAQFQGFRTAEDAITYERRLDGVIDRLEAVARPTIAAIEGYAVGGGAAIAMACDFRYCTPESQIGVPIARTLGNCLSMANCARLVDLVGPARAKDLIYRARLVGGDEALQPAS